MSNQQLKLYALDVVNNLPDDRTEALAVLEYARDIHGWATQRQCDLSATGDAAVISFPAGELDQKFLPGAVEADHKKLPTTTMRRRRRSVAIGGAIAVCIFCFSIGWMLELPELMAKIKRPPQFTAQADCTSQSTSSGLSARRP